MSASRSMSNQQFGGYYHGTDSAAAEAIKREGFSLDARERGGSDFGRVTYLTRDRTLAAEHAFGIQGAESYREDMDPYEVEYAEDGRILPVNLSPGARVLDAYKPPVEVKADALETWAQEKELSGQGWANPIESHINTAGRRHGYQAVMHGSNAHVLDPSVAKVDPSRKVEDIYDYRPDWDEEGSTWG